MANYYSAEVLEDMLKRTKQKRQPLVAPAYSEMAPKELNTVIPSDQNAYEDIANQISAGDESQTALSSVYARNKFNKGQLTTAQQLAQQAQKNFIKPVKPTVPNVPGGTVAPGGTANPQRWGKDRIPEVSDIAQLSPNGPMRTMNFHGMNYTVNRQVAPIFQSFLRDLWQMGYHPKSIGGYANRSIAGTNTPSLHSYGFAIDVDPSKNPVTWNGQNITALPRSVGSLAAKYGLSWGGAWQGSKRDPMHFAVPYQNREPVHAQPLP